MERNREMERCGCGEADICRKMDGEQKGEKDVEKQRDVEPWGDENKYGKVRNREMEGQRDEEAETKGSCKKKNPVAEMSVH